MNKKEYEKFMIYLYNKYVRKRTPNIYSEKWDHLSSREWKRLVSISNLLRYINCHFSDADEIYHTFKEERIEELPIEILRGVHRNRYMLEESGFMEIIDTYYDEIVSGMKMEHMPPQEIEVMRQLEILEEKLEKPEHPNLKDAGIKRPKKSRRWFKGLGQIAQGCALSIANVGLAVGAIPIPVAAETASWGAIISSITGVGTILNGIGEFKGE